MVVAIGVVANEEFTLVSVFSQLGAIYPSLPSANPLSAAILRLSSEVLLFTFDSQYICQLKQRSPAIVSAMIQFGETRQGIRIRITVCTFGKITVERVNLKFLRVGLSSHVSTFYYYEGPQAFAIIVAPTFSKVPIIPSRLP